MTPERRDLLRRVIDGRPEQEITFHLFEIARHVRCNEILRYLVSNKICGRQFLDLMRNTYQGSVLNFMADTIRKIDRDVVKRPIIVGRDWL